MPKAYPAHYRVELTRGFPLRENLRLYINKTLQYIARKALLPPNLRVKLQKMRGVKFVDAKAVFIGEDVFFDEVFPELITVGRNVMITEGTMIFSHLYDPSFSFHAMRIKKVQIEDNVFVGARSVIVNGVTLGRGCVVGTNSVVTKDVPPNAIVAGSPAKVVGHRGSGDVTELACIQTLRESEVAATL